MSNRPVTPQIHYTNSLGDAVEITVTPVNTQEVHMVISQILQGDTRNPAIATRLLKLEKAAIKAMADSSLQRLTNGDLITANRRQKARSKRSTAHYGQARILNLAVITERQQKQAEKEKEISDKKRAGEVQQS